MSPEWQCGDQFQLFDTMAGATMPASLAAAACYLPDYCSLDTATGVMTALPEPATLSLIAIGACLPLLRRRRR